MFTTRRGLLLGAAVIAVAGCTETEAQIAVPDADLAETLRHARVLSQAAEELGEAAIASDHQIHAETLIRLLSPAEVEMESVATQSITDRTALGEAEAEAGAQATAACLATTGDYAVVFGEISASRAAHAEVLG